MPHPYPATQRPSRHVGVSALALALVLVLACAPGPVARAGNGLQWRLEARVPVICAILDVETPADRPASLAVTTTCNAERYQLLLHPPEGQAVLRTARSSAGVVQIGAGTVTITGTRPGQALTTIELDAPVSAGPIAVTLQPL
jgi:hypothetical protein